MAPTTVHVKATSGSKITVSVELSLTVSELKATLAAENKANVPANQQRLIYRGHVMKDERTLESYGLADEHTVHLVKGPAPGGGTAAKTAPAAAAASATVPTPPAGGNAVPPSTGVGNAGTTGGFGGFGGFGGMGGFGGLGGMGAMGGDFSQMQQQMAQNPEMMREMMNSPLMRHAMEEMSRNPEMLRQMIQSDPRMREVMEANPELGHALSDPETIRRTLEVARNPELMREQMRLSDRAFANIESHPEGFNAMARMHQDVSEPMMRAAEGRGERGGHAPSTNAADNPFAAMFAANPVGGGEGGASAASSDAAAARGQTANAPGGRASPADPWAPAGGGAGGAGANPFASMFSTGVGFGGGGPFGGGTPFGGGAGGLPPDQMLSQMEAMLANPAMGPMMRSMMSDPAVIGQMLDADPALRAMAEANPGMREMLQNPEMLRRMSDPETLRNNLRAMRQMGMGTPGFGGGAGGGFGASPDPATPPEEMYASQLAQMKDMGFYDEAQNIRVLQQCMGNVSAAIERLLAGP